MKQEKKHKVSVTTNLAKLPSSLFSKEEEKKTIKTSVFRTKTTFEVEKTDDRFIEEESKVLD